MVKDIITMMNERVQAFTSKAKRLGKKVGRCQIVNKPGYKCAFIQICFDDERTTEEAKRAIDYVFSQCFNARLAPNEHISMLESDTSTSSFEVELDIVCPVDALSKNFYARNLKTSDRVKCWNPAKNNGGN